MRDLTDRPLLCMTFAFMAGIAVAARGGSGSLWLLLGCITLTALGVLLTRRKEAVGIVLLMVSAASGGLLLFVSERPGAQDVSQLPVGGQTIVGTVASAPGYANGLWRFILTAELHEHGAQREPVMGRTYVRLRAKAPVLRGERWRLTGKLRPVRAVGNPGQRTEADQLASLGVTAVLRSEEGMAERLGTSTMSALSQHAFRAQRAALRALTRYAGEPYRETTAAVAASVIFGVHASPPPRDITDIFRRAGTIHLLVVSGAMVSMVFGFIFLPSMLGAGWRRVRIERQFGWPARYRGRVTFRPGLWAALLAIATVTYYAMLTEGGQAVLRAAVMGVLGALALALRRVPAVAREHGLTVDAFTLLSAAALVVLIITPGALFQPGFQLSFIAVAAILYFTPKARWLVRSLPAWLGYGLLGTTIAQFATLPLLAWHFGQVPLAGFASNLLAVPLASVVLISGLATCGLAAVAPWVAPAPGWIMGWSARWLVWVSGAFASLPHASVATSRPPAALVVCWYLALVLLGAWLGKLDVSRARAGDR